MPAALVHQSGVPDWKMRKAVSTPTTPVSASASVGSGAVSPTFCAAAKDFQRPMPRIKTVLSLSVSQSKQEREAVPHLKHAFAGGELHGDRPDEAQHGAAAQPHVQPTAGAALGSLLAPHAQGPRPPARCTYMMQRIHATP